jgi:DNA helicase II / ATP-dependent DNA helicase PcrA
MAEHRVIGPPGTGKTTYLKRQFETAGDKYDVGELFACSLTKTAAHEIASRVDGVPDRNIGTLHAHAYRQLKHPQIVETAAGLKEWNEYCGTASYRISGKHASDPENATAEPTVVDSDGAELMHSMGVLRQRMVRRELWPGNVSRFAARWEQFKLESQRLDFTDLIEVALDRVDEIPDCKVLFVDEAQDMSKLEFALARKWGASAESLVVVGDPDQNLYEWRGSDPGAFYATEAASNRVLDQSYRVPEAVHRQALKWIRTIPDRVDASYRPIDRAGVHERPKLTYNDPDPLIDHALEQTASGEEAMILTSCRYMLNPLTMRMRERGIPFKNEYRASDNGWNPLNGSRRLLSFLRPNKQVWGDEARWWTWGDLRAWVEPLQSKGVLTRGLKTVIESRCVADRFGDTQEFDAVDPTWLFEQFVDDKHRDAVFNMDIEWWFEHLRHNDRKSQHFSMAVARRHGADRLREQPRVSVGTIHSVKGGESDHVYVLPDLSAAGYWDAWRTTGPRKWAVVRQFYVAMTRAKQTLYLCDPSTQMSVQWLS